MGQAKQRGTFEDRRAEAIQREEEEREKRRLRRQLEAKRDETKFALTMAAIMAVSIAGQR